MDYEITPDRQAYLDTRGFTILAACPGSGKTTSIVKKLEAVSRYCTSQYGPHTGFACLSFTNKACAELKDKYREMHGERLSFPNMVSTIDSFITQYVVLPFWYLCPICKLKPVIVNEADIQMSIYFVNVYRDGQWNTYLNRSLKDYKGIIFSKSPCEVSRDKDYFRWNNKLVTTPFEEAYCKAIFEFRLSKGYITSADALWMACDILERHPEIARAIASRFPYIIVDEAQDNSELHFMFFQLLKQAGIPNMEFVGDICQSIYGFNNARPKLLQDLMSDPEWTVRHLYLCRRSNQRIIDLYSKLKPQALPAIYSHNVVDREIPIVCYLYDDGNVREIINDFHEKCNRNGLGKRLLLARGAKKCKSLSGIRDLDFHYWKSEIPYLLIDAKFAYKDGETDYAFRKIRLAVALLKHTSDFDARREYIRSVEHDVGHNTKIFTFIQNLPSFSLSFAEWTTRTEQLIKDFWGLPVKPDFVPFKMKKGYKMKQMANVPVEQFHQSDDSQSDYYRCVSTIHSVKGATADAVLLFMSKDSRGEGVSLNDFPNHPIVEMTESQRLIYVACSRATQFLALAVPREISEATIKATLGQDVKVGKIGLQGELFFD